MLSKKIEEGFFDTAEDQIKSISMCFASAVEQVCKLEEKGRYALFFIARYIRENINGDVLEETQKIFYNSDIRGERGAISKEELGEILQRIRSLYFIFLPRYTLKGHKEDLKLFFNRIQEYAEKRIKKFSSHKR